MSDRGSRSQLESTGDDVDAAQSVAATARATPKRSAAPSWVWIVIGALTAPWLVLIAHRLIADRSNQPRYGVTTKSVATSTRASFIEQGFVEMVPPLRLPSRADGISKIEVWVKFPPRGKLGVRWLADQKRHTLTYPPGMIADRIELVDGIHIVDVRGTELGEGTEEIFHVYRRDGQGLKGFLWKRGDAQAQAESTRVLLAHVSATAKGSTKSLEQNNDCAGCHMHAREERRASVPARATDAAGWFVPETVLLDRAPADRHRPREMNAADPYVTFECPKGDGETVPAEFATQKQGMRWPTCPGGLAPIGVVDIASALEHHDERASKVCASRAALFAHMDAESRTAFARAFEVCSIR